MSNSNQTSTGITVIHIANLWKLFETTKFFRKFFLFFLVAHVLHVNGVFHLETLLDRRLVILLT